MSAVLVPLCIGVAFGWLLDRAGLTRFERIFGVYRLTDLAVLKFLGSGIVAGAVVVAAARALGFATVVPVAATNVAAQAIGGALLGAAMAIGGFCPGTIVAGAAGGRLDYLVAGGGGLVAGALAFDATARLVATPLAGTACAGALTLPSLLGVSGGLVATLLFEVAALGFYALERAVMSANRSSRASSRASSSGSADSGDPARRSR